MPEAPLVLIVEDDLSTRVLYRDYLTHCGFRIIDAHNGHQALAKAKELRPNVVLTDLAVPGMDGFEFCRAHLGRPFSYHVVKSSRFATWYDYRPGLGNPKPAHAAAPRCTSFER